MTQIFKEFTFDAAHQLPDHEGKCANLHGHTYKLQVCVSGPIKQSLGAPDDGMVVDFSVISDIWKTRLEPRLDHALLVGIRPLPWMKHMLPSLVDSGSICSSDDAKALTLMGFNRVTWLPIMVTTAELLATYIFDEFYRNLTSLSGGRSGVAVDEIRLWETPTGCVIARESR